MSEYETMHVVPAAPNTFVVFQITNEAGELTDELYKDPVIAWAIEFLPRNHIDEPSSISHPILTTGLCTADFVCYEFNGVRKED